MKTDAKGFILSSAIHPSQQSRQFVAIRAVELKALEESGHRSLQVLAKRVRDAMAASAARVTERLRRNQEFERLANQRRAERDQ